MSEHLCYMKPKPCKGGRCTQEIPCSDNPCYSCRTYTEDYIFFDMECSQNTGEHLINLAIAQDFQGNQYEFTNQKDFCEWLFRKEHKGSCIKMPVLGQVALNDPTPGKWAHSLTPPQGYIKEILSISMKKISLHSMIPQVKEKSPLKHASS